MYISCFVCAKHTCLVCGLKSHFLAYCRTIDYYRGLNLFFHIVLMFEGNIQQFEFFDLS